MSERPILFSAPMVRAILSGTKSQTRRVVKAQPSEEGAAAWNLGFGAAPPFRCPYGLPGDTLWVRESGLESLRARDFRLFAHDATPGRYWVDSDGGRYGASYGPAITRESMIKTGGWKVRPSIHMPRWASRITLRITDMRVERLNEISAADALAEGIVEYPCTGPHRGPGATYWSADGSEPFGPIKRTTPVAAYKALWEEINGDDSWDANPFVWCVAFQPVQP